VDFTLIYRLSATAGAEPQNLLEDLARSSLSFPEASVSPMWSRSRELPPEPPDRLGGFEIPVERRPSDLFMYSLEVRPIVAHAFALDPGRHCMPAYFGLGRYPETVFDPRSGRRLPTQMGPGWRWASWFSAEAALLDGVLHFLTCHFSVAAVLERAGALGCLSEVSDRTGFWEERDPVGLGWRAAEWSGADSRFEEPLERAVRESEFLHRPGRLRALVARLSRLSRTLATG
jgi:hypothetical protein